MNQDILTLIIVLSTITYTLYALVTQLALWLRGKNRNLSCAGCTGCTLHHPDKRNFQHDNLKLKPETHNSKLKT